MRTQVLNPIRPSMRLLTWLVAVLAICVAQSASFGQATLFVDDTAQGLNNGSSWQHAYTSLDSALTDPGVIIQGTVTQVSIAEGMYKPSIETVTGNPLTRSFALPAVSQDLLILGGFPNGGGVQNPDLHKTYSLRRPGRR